MKVRPWAWDNSPGRPRGLYRNGSHYDANDRCWTKHPGARPEKRHRQWRALMPTIGVPPGTDDERWAEINRG